jgi:hypothetical protein
VETPCSSSPSLPLGTIYVPLFDPLASQPRRIPTSDILFLHIRLQLSHSYDEPFLQGHRVSLHPFRPPVNVPMCQLRRIRASDGFLPPSITLMKSVLLAEPLPAFWNRLPPTCRPRTSNMSYLPWGFFLYTLRCSPNRSSVFSKTVRKGNGY